METKKNSNSASIIKTTGLLVVFSGVVSMIIGIAAFRIHQDNGHLQAFLEASSNLSQNFAESLDLYTGHVEDSMQVLNSYRPQTEQDYIDFISKVEDLGDAIHVPLDLKTLQASTKPDSTGSAYIDYQVQIFATEDQAVTLLGDIEKLPYFTRVRSLTFRSPELAASTGDATVPNFSFVLRLYVK